MVRRKTYLIKKRFQVRFITFFSFFTLAHLIVSGVWLYYLINSSLKDAMYRGHIKIVNLNDLIWPEVFRVNIVAGLILILLSIIIVFKIVGVINVQLAPLREHAMRISEGDLTVRLAPALNDLTGDLSLQMNVMTSNLEERFTALKKHLSVIQGKQKCVEQKIRDETLMPEVLKEWNGLARDIDFFLVELDGFVVENQE